MKKALLLLVLSMSTQANIFDSISKSWTSKFGNLDEKVRKEIIHPSTACIQKYEVSFKREANDLIIDSCNKLETYENYKCSSLLFAYSTVYPAAVEACSGMNSMDSLNVLYTFARQGYSAPKYPFVLTIGAANEKDEITCMTNIITYKKGSLSTSKLEKDCLNDSDQDLDNRELDIMGFILTERVAPTPMEEVKSSVDSFKDYVYSLFD